MLGAPLRHLPSPSSAQSTAPSVCAVARSRCRSAVRQWVAGRHGVLSLGLCAPMSALHEGMRQRPLRMWHRTAIHASAGGRPPWRSICNEHGTIHAISSDFGDRMTTQSMGLMLLLSEYF